MAPTAPRAASLLASARGAVAGRLRQLSLFRWQLVVTVLCGRKPHRALEDVPGRRKYAAKAGFTKFLHKGEDDGEALWGGTVRFLFVP